MAFLDVAAFKGALYGLMNLIPWSFFWLFPGTATWQFLVCFKSREAHRESQGDPGGPQDPKTFQKPLETYENQFSKALGKNSFFMAHLG